MMPFPLLPALFCALLGAAHLLRGEGAVAAAGILLLPFLFLLRRRWVPAAAGGLLLLGAAEWVRTACVIARGRIELGEPWHRMAWILGGVAVLHLVALWALRTPRVRNHFDRAERSAFSSAAAFLLTFSLLLIVRIAASGDLLLAERFLPGSFWIETALLSTWAAWGAEWLTDETRAARVRLRLWSLFSVVFFLQLILGLAGFERFLMTGTLHLPVPAMIVAGPLFRGEGFFMVAIFLGTLLLVGPAWCSYLCYIGAWDNAMASIRPKAEPPRGMSFLGRRLDPRWVTLAAVAAGALLLRFLGLPGPTAALLGGLFGLSGILLMLTLSRRKGRMVHCTEYCPIGLLAVGLGKISPFRLRIAEGCTSCSLCIPVCRYGALTTEDFKSGRPGTNCTLCGDCLPSCRRGFITYRFLRLSPERARRLFVALAAALHAVFLGVARL